MKPNVTVLMKLLEQAQAANKWTETLPNEVSDAFFDNPLTDNLHKSWLLLAESYFGSEWVDLVESVVWLDELTLSRPICFTREDGSKHSVEDIDQLCDYLIKFEGWEN